MVPPFTVGSCAMSTHSTPDTTPIPVTRLAPTWKPLPHAASGLELEEGRLGVEEQLHPLAGGELAPGPVALDVPGATPGAREVELLVELAEQSLEVGPPGGETGIRLVDGGREDGHADMLFANHICGPGDRADRGRARPIRSESRFMLTTFAGRTAVVTGAASGIGLGLARRCHDRGMNVAMLDVEAGALDAAAASWAIPSRVLPLVADVRDPDRMEAVAAEVVARFGAVHLLCNNAGISITGTGVGDDARRLALGSRRERRRCEQWRPRVRAADAGRRRRRARREHRFARGVDPDAARRGVLRDARPRSSRCRR